MYNPSEQACDILVLITHAQMLITNAHAKVSRETRGLVLGISLHLHPYVVYAISEGLRYQGRQQVL